MSKNIKHYCIISICAIALISMILFLLADNATFTTLTILFYLGIVATTSIWFLVAWHIYELKSIDKIIITVICATPYLLTLLLNSYMIPYEGSDNGNMWLIILGEYSNIFFNTNYHLLRAIVSVHIESIMPTILLFQILIPFALAFIIKGFNELFGKIESSRKNDKESHL